MINLYKMHFGSNQNNFSVGKERSRDSSNEVMIHDNIIALSNTIPTEEVLVNL